jgi:hypothetical protein
MMEPAPVSSQEAAAAAAVAAATCNMFAMLIDRLGDLEQAVRRLAEVQRVNDDVGPARRFCGLEHCDRPVVIDKRYDGLLSGVAYVPDLLPIQRSIQAASDALNQAHYFSGFSVTRVTATGVFLRFETTRSGGRVGLAELMRAVDAVCEFNACPKPTSTVRLFQVVEKPVELERFVMDSVAHAGQDAVMSKKWRALGPVLRDVVRSSTDVRLRAFVDPRQIREWERGLVL